MYILSLAEVWVGLELIGVLVEVVDVVQLLGDAVPGDQGRRRDHQEQIDFLPELHRALGVMASLLGLLEHGGLKRGEGRWLHGSEGPHLTRGGRGRQATLHPTLQRKCHFFPEDFFFCCWKSIDCFLNWIRFSIESLVLSFWLGKWISSPWEADSLPRDSKWFCPVGSQRPPPRISFRLPKKRLPRLRLHSNNSKTSNWKRKICWTYSWNNIKSWILWKPRPPTAHHHL